MGMLRSIKSTLGHHWINARGWRSPHPILVIESDDWGATRMPDEKTAQAWQKTYPKASQNPFNRWDGLERAADLERLAELCQSFQDADGKNLVVTCNMIMANPDFEAMRQVGFTQFASERFFESYQKYGEENMPSKWKDAMGQGLLLPQFHGWVHLQYFSWIDHLQKGDPECTTAAEMGHCAVSDSKLWSAYDAQNEAQKVQIHESIRRGLREFEQAFGYRSRTSVAPRFIWDQDIEQLLAQEGVEGNQTVWKSTYPAATQSRYFTGKKNQYGQHYLTRNVNFEPSTKPDFDWVDHALRQISVAWTWGRPAIINSHRINYSSRISSNPADQNLSLLRELIRQIQKKWPSVRFMDSAALLQQIKSS